MLLIEFVIVGLDGYFSKNRPNSPSYIIHINVQGCIVLTHSYGELNCDRLHNYYNYFHLCQT